LLPLSLAGAVLLYPFVLIFVFVAMIVLTGAALERLFLRCQYCGGRAFKSVKIDPPIKSGDDLVGGRQVCLKCGKDVALDAVSR